MRRSQGNTSPLSDIDKTKNTPKGWLIRNDTREGLFIRHRQRRGKVKSYPNKQRMVFDPKGQS